MSVPLTLDALFTRTGQPPGYYHAGRRVIPCARSHMQAFEAQELAWEAPWQGHARLAIVFPGVRNGDPNLWCLGLPLDEQGMLQPGPRDALIERLLHSMNAPDRAEKEDLTSEPLAFQPDTLTLAMLHARITHDLALPASSWWQPAHEALTVADTGRHWSTLGLQGVADTVVRRTREEEMQIAERLPHLSVEALHALCYCLEHAPPATDALVTALWLRSQAEIEATASFRACQRAGISSELPDAATWVDTLLRHEPDDETLAVIAARGWPHLEHEERLKLFLDHLARRPSASFRALISDLALIPRLRLPVLMLMRQADRDTPLAHQVRMMLGKTAS